MDGLPFMAIRRKFLLICYRHWSSLILCNGNGTSSFLQSVEGVTQGGPLAMVDYGIGVLLFVKQLKAQYLGVTRPWYADDVGSLGTYENIRLYFNLLKQTVPGCGY